MLSNKLRNIALSLILVALYASAILFLSAKDTSSVIASSYFWVKSAILVSGFGGAIILALRMFKVINRERNFLYAFLGTANIVLGILGICSYLLGKVNLTGLHDTIPNLFFGVVILTDIFLFETIFKKNETN